jgi:hypothetical protein
MYEAAANPGGLFYSTSSPLAGWPFKRNVLGN